MLSLLLSVSGMDDDCCAQKVAVALRAVEPVQGVLVSGSRGLACVTSTTPVDAGKLQAALAAAGYSATRVESVPACPEGLSPPAKDPWAGIDDLDAKVISRGEEVDLAAHAVKGKYTVYDFGADWCAPCQVTAATLQAYLRTHADVAVRAVLLDGADARVSFALPVAKQQLKWAEGLPWLVVRGPDGKQIYQGSAVADALAAIDKKRK